MNPTQKQISLNRPTSKGKLPTNRPVAGESPTGSGHAQELTASRSPAAVECLERLQAREGNRSGDIRKPEDDARVLREIAQRQLLAERLDAQSFTSHEQMRDALIDLVGQPSYEAQVEERAKSMERFFAESDGDIWSRYERPDRRRRLSDLVLRVEEGASRRGYRVPRRPVIGTLPTYKINAEAIPGPPGEGHLVVFDSGMFSYSSVLAKVAAQAIDAKPNDDGSALIFNPDAMHRHPEQYIGVVRQFADLLFSQAILGTCVYTEVVSIPPEHVPFAEQLTEAVDTFILAHEYGHVILGHVDVHGSREIDPPAAHEQEFAADEVGFEICTAAWNGPLWSYLGASVFLSASEAVTRATNTFLTGAPEGPPSSTHPPEAARRRALAKLPGSGATGRHASVMADAIDRAFERLTTFLQRAFAKAHRDGFPEAGYRPADEYAKTAAFESFLNAGLAPG